MRKTQRYQELSSLPAHVVAWVVDFVNTFYTFVPKQWLRVTCPPSINNFQLPMKVPGSMLSFFV